MLGTTVVAARNASSDYAEFGDPADLVITERHRKRTTDWRARCGCGWENTQHVMRALIPHVAAHVEAAHGDEIRSLRERRSY